MKSTMDLCDEKNAAFFRDEGFPRNRCCICGDRTPQPHQLTRSPRREWSRTGGGINGGRQHHHDQHVNRHECKLEVQRVTEVTKIVQGSQT
ncbi:hypothetical protein PoB_003455800 [Plakobranchus ocellatus]|uniref:Uncharacterized protein n=1 Tax=Plakobranchus ocellatus TaxID=259542 RepID=A0AAV4ANB5_9GAST|nr:hypothetical protein PoB_003455800 [Plakobranchus ocellatus]